MFLKNKKTGIVIGTDFMPGRKKPCLVVFEGNCETKYASFNSVEAAVEFMKILGKFVGVQND